MRGHRVRFPRSRHKTPRCQMAVLRIAVGALVCLTSAASSPAATPTLDVSQLAHAAWTLGDGFAKGAIHSIAQTPDGYLWLGTEFGLLRFDGVTATPGPSDHPLETEIPALLTGRDGTLWIGMSGGLASWKDGHLTRYAEVERGRVLSLLEARDGTVWVIGVLPPNRRVCAIRNGSMECMSEESRFGPNIRTMYEDRRGNLWFVEPQGLWQWNHGQPIFYPLKIDQTIQALAEDADGVLLVVQAGRIDRLVGGELQKAYQLPSSLGPTLTNKVLRDQDGGIWIGSLGGGVAHLHNGRVDQFSRSDGLTSDSVGSFLQDRDGNIWVSTRGGLDRFRETLGTQFTRQQGFSNLQVTAVVASTDGSVWVRTVDGLNRWKDGRVTVYREFPDLAGRTTGRAAVGPTNFTVYGNALVQGGGSLFEEQRGRIWVSGSNVGYLDHGRFTAVGGVPVGSVSAMTGDRQENIWLAHLTAGLLRVSGDRVVERIPWVRIGHTDYGRVLAMASMTGSLWIGFIGGGVDVFKDGRISASYREKQGLAGGRVNDLRFGQDGALWVSTITGSSRIKNGQVMTLSSGDGLPCDAVNWTIEDDSGNLWLSMRCGLVRIAHSDIGKWEHLTAAERPLQIPIRVFDSSDGIQPRFYEGPFSPRVARAPDGKVWFFPLEGLAALDPTHLSRNTLPPLLHIEYIDADNRRFPGSQAGPVRLPPRSRDIEIGYTGLSFANPQGLSFRYRLDGRAGEWQDAGSRRQVLYSGLPPGPYRFQVIAATRDGTWNETGSSIDFIIAPAYYQTAWFRALVVVATLTLLWALYRLRLRQLAREFDGRLHERVTERSRIARALDDTPLQMYQGLMRRRPVVDGLLPAGKAKHQLAEALERADQAIAEGREAVYGLRDTAATTNDLAESVRALGKELATQDSAGFQLVVEGRTRDLNPIVRDEVYRITREALRNAFNHARAHRVEAEIAYGERAFRMRIRDDGERIHPRTLEEGRAGHYGLQGMRERAKQVAGTLDIWSRPGAGTEIDLSIAGAIAYGQTTDRRWLDLFRRRTG